MHDKNSLFEKYKMKILSIGLIIPMIGSAAGCGASSAEMTIEHEGPVASSVEVTLDYTVPVQLPNVLVDQVGYGTDSEKAIVFRGEDLPDSFKICNLDTGKVVYTGEILKSVYNEELSEYDSLGYFNDFKEPGDYFVYVDVVGESYSFGIDDDIYGDVFNSACKKYYMNRCGIALSENYAGESAHSACHTSMAKLQENPDTQIDVSGGWHLDEQAGRHTAMGSSVAEDLILAYEMNPEAFKDDSGIPESGNNIPDILDEVKYEMEWLLKMQDTRTGGEYGAALTDVQGGSDIFAAPVYVTPIDLDATIAFASMAARFSYFYQQFDPEFATTCLKAADRAWTCYLNNKSPEDNTAAFKAAAQLYRATGKDSYHQVLKSFFSRSDFDELFNTDKNAFLGAVTYLSINQAVDVDICTALMKKLMNRAEVIAEKASKNSYPVTDPGVEKGFDKMLDDMLCLTITDHIIYNHEYTTIIENHVHYLAGMNPMAINYVTKDTERTYDSQGVPGVMNDPGSDALFVFMLSVLMK